MPNPIPSAPAADPPHPRLQPSSSPQERLLLALYAACAVLYGVFHFYKTIHFHADADDARSRAFAENMARSLASFTAKKPFQYRILVPLLARALHSGLHLPLMAAYQGLEIAATLALLVAFRRYLALFFPREFCWFAPLLLLYPMLWNYCILSPLFYPYDTPAIFFFVAGLVCLLQKQWRWYYPLFVLATLNRETSVFLVFAFGLIWGRRLPWPQLAGHVLLQMALWLGIKAALAHVFAANPGDAVFQSQVNSNRQLGLDLLHGSLHMVHFLVTVSGAVWLLIPVRWNRHPPLFKRLLWLLVPFGLGMSIVGVLDEVRIYSELVPLLTASALAALYAVFFLSEPTEAEGRAKPVPAP